MTSPRLVVGAMVVDSFFNPTRVLAARRLGPADLAGKWEFPGGKVEPGETPQDALVRELREELSIDVIVGRELVSPGGELWPASGGFVMRLFYAEITGGEVEVGDSHDAVLWLDSSSLGSVDWLESDKEAIGYAL